MSLDMETILPDTHSMTSVTHVGVNEKAEIAKDRVSLENLDDDWENDPENARNWSSARKWKATASVSALVFVYLVFELKVFSSSQVSFYTFVSPLASTMMASDLPEIATKYGITNSSVSALTLSIFLLAIALGVGVFLPYPQHSTNLFDNSPLFSLLYLRCMDELG